MGYINKLSSRDNSNADTIESSNIVMELLPSLYDMNHFLTADISIISIPAMIPVANTVYIASPSKSALNKVHANIFILNV